MQVNFLNINIKNILPLHLKKKIKLHANFISMQQTHTWYDYFEINGLKKDNKYLTNNYNGNKKLSVFFISNNNMVESKWNFEKTYHYHYALLQQKKQRLFFFIKSGFILKSKFKSYYNDLLLYKANFNKEIKSFDFFINKYLYSSKVKVIIKLNIIQKKIRLFKFNVKYFLKHLCKRRLKPKKKHKKKRIKKRAKKRYKRYKRRFKKFVPYYLRKYKWINTFGLISSRRKVKKYFLRSKSSHKRVVKTKLFLRKNKSCNTQSYFTRKNQFRLKSKYILNKKNKKNKNYIYKLPLKFKRRKKKRGFVEKKTLPQRIKELKNKKNVKKKKVRLLKKKKKMRILRHMQLFKLYHELKISVQPKYNRFLYVSYLRFLAGANRHNRLFKNRGKRKKFTALVKKQKHNWAYWNKNKKRYWKRLRYYQKYKKTYWNKKKIHKKTYWNKKKKHNWAYWNKKKIHKKTHWNKKKIHKKTQVPRKVCLNKKKIHKKIQVPRKVCLNKHKRLNFFNIEKNTNSNKFICVNKPLVFKNMIKQLFDSKNLKFSQITLKRTLAQNIVSSKFHERSILPSKVKKPMWFIFLKHHFKKKQKLSIFSEKSDEIVPMKRPVIPEKKNKTVPMKKPIIQEKESKRVPVKKPMKMLIINKLGKIISMKKGIIQGKKDLTIHEKVSKAIHGIVGKTRQEKASQIIPMKKAIIQGNKAIIQGKKAVIVQGKKDKTIPMKKPIIQGKKDKTIPMKKPIIQGKKAIISMKKAIIQGNKAIIQGKKAVIVQKKPIVSKKLITIRKKRIYYRKGFFFFGQRTKPLPVLYRFRKKRVLLKNKRTNKKNHKKSNKKNHKKSNKNTQTMCKRNKMYKKKSRQLLLKTRIPLHIFNALTVWKQATRKFYKSKQWLKRTTPRLSRARRLVSCGKLTVYKFKTKVSSRFAKMYKPLIKQCKLMGNDFQFIQIYKQLIKQRLVPTVLNAAAKYVYTAVSYKNIRRVLKNIYINATQFIQKKKSEKRKFKLKEIIIKNAHNIRKNVKKKYKNNKKQKFLKPIFLKKNFFLKKIIKTFVSYYFLKSRFDINKMLSSKYLIYIYIKRHLKKPSKCKLSTLNLKKYSKYKQMRLIKNRLKVEKWHKRFNFYNNRLNSIATFRKYELSLFKRKKKQRIKTRKLLIRFKLLNLKTISFKSFIKGRDNKRFNKRFYPYIKSPLRALTRASRKKKKTRVISELHDKPDNSGLSAQDKLKNSRLILQAKLKQKKKNKRVKFLRLRKQRKLRRSIVRKKMRWQKKILRRCKFARRWKAPRALIYKVNTFKFKTFL